MKRCKCCITEISHVSAVYHELHQVKSGVRGTVLIALFRSFFARALSSSSEGPTVPPPSPSLVAWRLAQIHAAVHERRRHMRNGHTGGCHGVMNEEMCAGKASPFVSGGGQMFSELRKTTASHLSCLIFTSAGRSSYSGQPKTTCQARNPINFNFSQE